MAWSARDDALRKGRPHVMIGRMRIRATSIAEWDRITRDHIVPLRFSRAEEDFTAAYESRPLASGVGLFTLATGSVLVSRDLNARCSEDRDDIFVAVQLRSFGVLKKYGRSAIMPTGSIAVFDGRHPYSFDHLGGRQRQLTVRIDRESLSLSDRRMRRLTGSSLLPDLVATRILRAGLIAAWDGSRSVPDVQRPGCAGTVMDPVTSVFERLDGEYSLRGDRLLRRMMEHVRMCSADPMLDAEQVARAHHVSVRTAYEAFAESGTTPAAAIRSARVEHAAAIYRAAGAPAPPVGEVAQAVGFRDTTTFSRAFSAHLGLSPAAWAKQTTS